MTHGPVNWSASCLGMLSVEGDVLSFSLLLVS